MKRKLQTDEWYPVYSLIEPENEKYAKDAPHYEISDTLAARIEAAFKEFSEVQRILQNLAEA